MRSNDTRPHKNEVNEPNEPIGHGGRSDTSDSRASDTGKDEEGAQPLDGSTACGQIVLPDALVVTGP